MKRQREHSKPILPYRLIVDLHVVVKCFFITQVEIIFHMAVCKHSMRRLILFFGQIILGGGL